MVVSPLRSTGGVERTSFWPLKEKRSGNWSTSALENQLRSGLPCCGKTTDAAARHKFPWAAHRRLAARIEPLRNLAPLVCRCSTRRTALMTLSSGASRPVYDSVIMFLECVWRAFAPPGCQATSEVFEIAADTSETGTLDTTPRSR